VKVIKNIMYLSFGEKFENIYDAKIYEVKILKEQIKDIENNEEFSEYNKKKEKHMMIYII